MKNFHIASIIFCVFCYAVALATCGLLLIVPDVIFVNQALAIFCFVAVCVLPFVAFLPFPILAWIEEWQEQQAIGKSHQIMSYRHDLDTYFEKLQAEIACINCLYQALTERNTDMISPEEFSEWKQAVQEELATVPSYVSRDPEIVFQFDGWFETVYAEQDGIRLVECSRNGYVDMYRLETPNALVTNRAYYAEQNAIAAFYSSLPTISSKIV